MGPTPAAPAIRHRPSLGAIVAGIGLLLVLLGVSGLPWATVAEEDVTRSDIQKTYEGQLEAELEDVDFLGEYTQWMWIVGLALLAVAVLFSTLVVPSSKGVRVVIGLLTGGLIGLAVNAVDDEGTFGPRVTAALNVLCVAMLHGFALFLFFDEFQDFEPDTGTGVWAALAGFALVLLGCVLGTRLERGTPAPAPAPGPMPMYR